MDKKKKIENKKIEIKTKHLTELKNKQNDFTPKINTKDLPSELIEFIPVFKKWGIDDLKNDIEIIDDITINSNKSKHQIDSVLREHIISDDFKRNGDTIYLNNSYLIIKNDTLNKIGVE